MIKRTSIAFLFLLVFALLVSHDMIPHSHEHEKNVAFHKHAPEQQHGHEHQEDGDNDDNDLSDAYSLFQHATSKGNEFSIPENNCRIGCKIIEDHFLLPEKLDFAFDNGSPPFLASKPYDPLLAQSAIPYFFSLKAPPLM